MKALAHLAAAVAGLALALSIPPAQALAAQPAAPSCDLGLTDVVSNAHPILGHSVTFTLTATVRCNVDAQVVVDDPLPAGLAQDPPGEANKFQFSAPANRQVTRVFTIGTSVPAPDGCGVHVTNTASAFAKLPQGEGALAAANAPAALTTTCVSGTAPTTPLLPATGAHV
jgi:hypothetical protein